MSIIKTITLTKSYDPVFRHSQTTASVEFSPERFSVALTESDEFRHSRPYGAEEAWHRERQIREVSHRITAGIQREIAEALTRLDTVVRKGESITLRVAR